MKLQSIFGCKLVSGVLAVLLCFQSANVFGWGNEGHEYVNRVAAEHLPPDMPRFLRHAITEITYLGPEPDRWRSPSEFALKNAQEPDHFIDLERVAWLDPLPPGRYEFYRKLYEKRATTTDHPDDYLPERVGLQPYITMEVYGRLKAAFREYRNLRETHKPTASVEQAIIFYAGWLGTLRCRRFPTAAHHHSIQRMGRSKSERIHHRARNSCQVRNHIRRAEHHRQRLCQIRSRPERLADPFSDYVAYLRESNRQVEKVYAIEKAGGFNGKGSPEAFDFTTHRLAAGSQMLLDMWYTAWLESAINPEVPQATTALSPKK